MKMQTSSKSHSIHAPVPKGFLPCQTHWFHRWSGKDQDWISQRASAQLRHPPHHRLSPREHHRFYGSSKRPGLKEPAGRTVPQPLAVRCDASSILSGARSGLPALPGAPGRPPRADHDAESKEKLWQPEQARLLAVWSLSRKPQSNRRTSASFPSLLHPHAILPHELPDVLHVSLAEQETLLSIPKCRTCSADACSSPARRPEASGSSSLGILPDLN